MVYRCGIIGVWSYHWTPPSMHFALCLSSSFKNRKPERKPESETTQVDTTYQELDLTKMNKEDNYQSLRVNAASNDDDSTYTELKKTRDVEDNYQSLT